MDLVFIAMVSGLLDMFETRVRIKQHCLVLKEIISTLYKGLQDRFENIQSSATLKHCP
jgi:hypothetical protein